MGWLSSLISKLAGPPPTCYHDVREIMKVPTALSNAGQFEFDLVGESNYQRRIWSLLPDEITNQDKHRAYFIGDINLEDDNEFDKKAVNFSIDGRIVGYFPKDAARKFRKLIEKHDLNPNKLTCKSVVIGGKDKSYGVWLEINLTDIK